MRRKFLVFVSLIFCASSVFSQAPVHDSTLAAAEPVAFEIEAPLEKEKRFETRKLIEDRTFYTGSLQWFFQAASTTGGLSMRGHDSSEHGGTITRVEGCFYNDSAFQRTFSATMSVRQAGRTIQSITFSRGFAGQRITCHALTRFSAVVAPGDFEVVVSYDRGDDENFWLGLPVTTGGQAFDVQVGSQRPPTVNGSQGPLTVRGVGIEYRIDLEEGPANPSLAELDALIVPGFAVDLETAGGETTFFAVRNTSDATIDVVAEYYGPGVGFDSEPLRTDAFRLGPQATRTANVAADLSDLEVVDGFARGLIVLREEGGTAAVLTGDYFRVDGSNDFATGGRLVEAGDFCQQAEVRFVDFGSGSDFRVLLDQPPGEGEVAFSYVAYDEAGAVVAEGDVTTSDHLNLFAIEDFVDSTRFGTLVFDFEPSEAGWISGRYSAFGRFSVELESACLD